MGQHVAEDVASIERRQGKKVEGGEKQIQQHAEVENEGQRVGHRAHGHELRIEPAETSESHGTHAGQPRPATSWR